MKPLIFHYSSYKDFLRDLMATYPNGGRGLRQKIATAAGCQTPYVSHVLNEDYHFSAEHLEGIARHFGLTLEEKEFLLNLLQFARAGTPALREFYRGILSRISLKQSQLKERLKARATLDESARATYYSSWHYAAIHMLCTVPEFQTRDAISQRLKVPIQKTDDVIQFLIENGLLERRQNRLHALNTDVHLEQTSALIERHHSNWRLQAMRSFDQVNNDDLHYSLAFTVAKEDLPRIRRALSTALEKCAEIIRPSKEEDLCALVVDLFSVAGS